MIRCRAQGSSVAGAALSLVLLAVPTVLAQGIRGTVRAPQNSLENVRVDLFVDGRLVRTTYTNAEGSYSLVGVPEGFVELAHSRLGLATVTVAAGTYVYPQSYSLEVIMPRHLEFPESNTTVRLVLTFLDGDSGEPLTERRIELEGWGEFETDSLGRLAIHDPPKGRVLKFRTEGYRAQVLQERIYSSYHRRVVRLKREQ